MTLDNDLARILGLFDPPKVAAAAPITSPFSKNKNSWAPPRPAELYEYRVDVTRSEYGSAFITAESADSAFEQVSSGDIDWNDSGDIDWDSANTERSGDEPANQDELDEWDAKFGNKFDIDGEPKCSDCEDNFRAEDLVQDPGDSHAWYCDSCAVNNLDPIKP